MSNPMRDEETIEKIRKTLTRRYESAASFVPPAVYHKVRHSIEKFGAPFVLEVLEEMLRVEREGVVVRNPGNWIESVCANRAAILNRSGRSADYTSLPEVPCGCKDGFDEKARHCCRRCERGRARARNMALAIREEYTSKIGRAKTIEQAKALESIMGRKLDGLLKPIPPIPGER